MGRPGTPVEWAVCGHWKIHIGEYLGNDSLCFGEFIHRGCHAVVEQSVVRLY